MELDEFRRLVVVHNEMEAEIACGRLRTGGIEAFYRQTDVAAGREGYGGGPVEICVRESDYARAEELIRS